MISQERYFLHLDGIQRGPYTVQQIGHMVNSGIVHSSAMFWCEGLEQWQPVTQLIVPKAEIKRRRIRWSAKTLGALAFLLALLWIALPTLREGWREQRQIEKNSQSAYWRARGVLRESVGWFSGVRFDAFDPSKVVLLEGDRAAVELTAQIAPFFGESRVGRWRVDLKYDNRLRMWVPGEGQAAPPDEATVPDASAPKKPEDPQTPPAPVDENPAPRSP